VIEARALGESVDDALVTFTVSAGPVADTPADDAGEASDGAEGAVARTEASGDVAADAEALDARLDGWAYRLPGFKREQIFRRMEDLLRDREPASP
jgi:acyl-CoA reductase-like NAD-dependent aldehyde dehydrogenase